MRLSAQIVDYVHATFTGIWIQTFEPDEAEREIAEVARRRNWRLAVWDVAGGLRFPGNARPETLDVAAGDPVAVLRALPALASPDGTSLLLLHNFHRFLQSPEVVQTVFAQLLAGKETRTFVVVLSPTVNIPAEIEKQFLVLEHSLPDREQLQDLVRSLLGDRPEEMPQGQDLERVLDSASGLTRYEAENAFSLSLARNNALRPESVWEIKAQTLRKNNLLSLHRGGERFDALGGLDHLKDFCRRVLQPGKTVRPRGILLLGVPGTGKSAFAKALGNELGRPTLLLDIGTLMGSLVGQSEQNIRQALRIADAMAPCILFVDELEKALAGIGGNGDSGVATRLFGTLLTWLSDHQSDVFFVGTSNDISKLPPEFSRAERFDGVFFLDLPNVKEKDAIWSLYRRHFVIPDAQERPDDTSWTGAEIRSCCRLSALLDVPLTQAARNVVPVAVTAAESMERLRTWAAGRCLNASQPGIYGRNGSEVRPRRRMHREPENN